MTAEHREGDRESPAGVLAPHDAGGLLAGPGSKLPRTRSTAFTAPSCRPAGRRHDVDHVTAIDDNRVVGIRPSDPTRPLGRCRGGWIHLDHGRGTSACVSVDEDAARLPLTTLDPAPHPMIVMSDARHLVG